MKHKKGIVFAGMGFELVGLMISALFVGQKLEKIYSANGLIIVFLSFLALAIWIYHLIILTKQFQKNSEKE